MGDKKVKCIIVSGAPDNDIQFIKRKLDRSAFIIAADSGYKNCLKAGVIPDLIIGDFDSSSCPQFGNRVIRLPIEKDDTDTFYCVKEAVNRGYSEIELLCAIGDRVDHTYSNILCLEYCRQNSVDCTIINAKNKIRLVENEIEFEEEDYHYFSVFAFLGSAKGVSIKGAYYETDNVDIEPWSQFAQSNHFNGGKVKISVKDGKILLIMSND